jgi:hypothetical protein
VKTIRGESFEVRLEDNNATVSFKGALRLSGSEDYVPILDLLRATLVDAAPLIILDLRELDFLNSSGITMFSRFVIEARDHPGGIALEFLASETVPWHARSLRNLQRLMPSMSIRLT